MKEELSIIENTTKGRNSYGYLYGSERKIITQNDIEALLKGKALAFTINDEYTVFLSMGDVKEGIK